MAVKFRKRRILIAGYTAFLSICIGHATPQQAVEELQREPTVSGRYGGRLIAAQKAEPKTFNPLTAVDAPSREVMGLITGDLVHINRFSFQTEPALAKSWTVSEDGRVYVLRLRRGVRFSDGYPMDADDVLFTFRACLDKQTEAPQRDLLIIQGKPVTVRKIDAYTVQFELAAPYAAAERLFDSVAILPHHLLFKAYQEGNLSRAWGLNTRPDEMAGLGPFRLKAYVPGQRIVLERNPYYWKTDRHGRRLPFLDEIVLAFVPNEDIQMVQFLAGSLDILSSISAQNFLQLKTNARSSNFRTYDLGPGLEYNFLVFNMNEPEKHADADVGTKQLWFRNLAFRRAVSAAIDRQAIVSLVYRGLADPIWEHVTPGNKLWIDPQIARSPYSPTDARSILRSAAFSWRDGALIDAQGKPVEFSILTSAGNLQRAQIATIVQQDLQQLGIATSVVSLEFGTMLNRILKQFDYDAAVMTLASGDADPNSEMSVWLSDGGLHVWNLTGKPQTPWESEIDRLMRLQMITLRYPERRRLYDRMQQLVAENLPIVCVASPHILVAATSRLRNFQPAVLRSYAFWNAEILFLSE
ncbi:MAG: ABC transporter substrate-binding protein [Bryobacterales bacterium]|nr:ABC transporter substrate-binding protein [Bryobacterales bacterium]